MFTSNSVIRVHLNRKRKRKQPFHEWGGDLFQVLLIFRYFRCQILRIAEIFVYAFSLDYGRATEIKVGRYFGLKDD